MRVDLGECLCVAYQVHAMKKKIWRLFYLCRVTGYRLESLVLGEQECRCLTSAIPMRRA